jgi:Domain of unknown function (DUF4384)
MGFIRSHRTVLPAVLALAALAAACMETGVGSIAMDAGRKLLMGTAKKNFGADYNDTFSRMIDILMLRTVAGAPGAPGAPGDSGPTGYEPTAYAEAGAASQGSLAQAPPAAPEPIALELTVVREVVLDGRSVPVPLEDGALLRDGVGRPGEKGDDLKVRFEVNVPCYVYAVWVDATAWATPLFPEGPGYAFENPVQPHKSYGLPGGDDWFYLDDYRGVETVYVVASREPLADLEQVLGELHGKERAFRQDVERPTLLDEPGEVTRGLAGTRPGRADVVARDGTSHEVETQAFIAGLASGELVVTRWFHHE